MVIEDNCVLDAKGSSNKGISIGRRSNCNPRNVVLSCKNGDIAVGSNTVIGINSLIHAVEGSNVSVGQDVLHICLCIHNRRRQLSLGKPDLPIRKQGLVSKGGIDIGSNVWLGASVNVTDGVTIAEGNIIGAYSLVNKSIETRDYISFGVPAKPHKSRIQ
ncbi:MAG: hypothetical protein U5N58_02430 [Actinomycetota bacterium]|nr:hypothetical protein [Actinomycetota bacterium]